MKAYRNEKLLNATLLIFGYSPNRFFLSSEKFFVTIIRRCKDIAFEKVGGQIISNVTEKRVSLLINLIKKNNKITIAEMATIYG
jgi:hypothetical protein